MEKSNTNKFIYNTASTLKLHVTSLAMQSVSQVNSSKKSEIRRFKKAQMKQRLKRKFF